MLMKIDHWAQLPAYHGSRGPVGPLEGARAAAARAPLWPGPASGSGQVQVVAWWSRGAHLAFGWF